jgi:hypothetical protein
MKTIEQIRRRMNTLESEHDPRAKNVKAKKEYSFLKEVCRYLETRPRPEFIQNERQRLVRSMEILDSRFDQWLKNTPKAELSGVDDF